VQRLDDERQRLESALADQAARTEALAAVVRGLQATLAARER